MKAKKVQESLEEFLPPKSMEEIHDKMKEVISTLSEYATCQEFLDQPSHDKETDDSQDDTRKLCQIMNSNPKDVYYIVEDWGDYEKVWGLLRKIENEWRHHTDESPIINFTGTDLTYRINPETKIAFGHSIDFNSMDLIFFDQPHLLKLIDEWEKLPT